MANLLKSRGDVRLGSWYDVDELEVDAYGRILKATEVREPGKRGGKFYRTKGGKVKYGEQPAPAPSTAASQGSQSLPELKNAIRKLGYNAVATYGGEIPLDEFDPYGLGGVNRSPGMEYRGTIERRGHKHYLVDAVPEGFTWGPAQGLPNAVGGGMWPLMRPRRARLPEQPGRRYPY